MSTTNSAGWDAGTSMHPAIGDEAEHDPFALDDEIAHLDRGGDVAGWVRDSAEEPPVRTTASHTPGPWRWEINEKHKHVHLVGGRPQYDLTILEPIRWGMNRATFFIRDTAFDGLNLMHKLHERRDWIEPFAGRDHHKHWCANVVHPDMRLIAAAPDLLEAAQAEEEWRGREAAGELDPEWDYETMVASKRRAAIAKAGVASS